ncbi:hypothetical protein [Sessilibacter corallicola]|nr:hypothetical protein [Sessilibacter corallicola]
MEHFLLDDSRFIRHWEFLETLGTARNGTPGGIRTPDQVVRSHIV